MEKITQKSESVLVKKAVYEEPSFEKCFLSKVDVLTTSGSTFSTGTADVFDDGRDWL